MPRVIRYQQPTAWEQLRHNSPTAQRRHRIRRIANEQNRMACVPAKSALVLITRFNLPRRAAHLERRPYGTRSRRNAFE